MSTQELEQKVQLLKSKLTEIHNSINNHEFDLVSIQASDLKSMCIMVNYFANKLANSEE